MIIPENVCCECVFIIYKESSDDGKQVEFLKSSNNYKDGFFNLIISLFTLSHLSYKILNGIMSLLMMFMRDSPLHERTLNTGEMYHSFNMAFQPFDEFLTTALQVDMHRFGNLQLVAYKTSKALPDGGDRGCYSATPIMYH